MLSRHIGGHRTFINPFQMMQERLAGRGVRRSACRRAEVEKGERPCASCNLSKATSGNPGVSLFGRSTDGIPRQ